LIDPLPPGCKLRLLLFICLDESFYFLDPQTVHIDCRVCKRAGEFFVLCVKLVEPREYCLLLTFQFSYEAFLPLVILSFLFLLRSLNLLRFTQPLMFSVCLCLFCFFAEVVGIVAHEESRVPLAKFEHLRCKLFDEVAVVRYEDECSLVCCEGVEQYILRSEVQVVCWFIEKK